MCITYQQGWKCPYCNIVHAPWVQQCTCQQMYTNPQPLLPYSYWYYCPTTTEYYGAVGGISGSN